MSKTREVQFLLPGLPMANPNPTKLRSKDRTSRGKLRTGRGYDREVEAERDISAEERDAQRHYELTGEDRTDGHVYWPTAFRI